TRQGVRQQVKDSLIKQYPTMETLFGSLDYCECEQCRSVLSPAAYLVDLFQFLDPKPAVWAHFLTTWQAQHGGPPHPLSHQPPSPFSNQPALDDWKQKRPGETPLLEKTPYDMLTRRRPDLPNLQLTCENTNTVLPYIDIVNEVLEYYVAHAQLTPEAAHQTGT